MAVYFITIVILSSFLILYTYVFYPIILIIYSKIKKNDNNKINDIEKNEFAPDVSVLIAAHNEEKVIEEKIKNTLEIDYPHEKIEIRIGSDGSEDKTDEICRKYLDRINFIKIKPRQGKPNVLNTLYNGARGDILLLTDANTIIEKNALKKMLVHFVDDSVGAVCGRLALLSKSHCLESYEKNYWNYESKIKHLESLAYSTLASNGGIYMVRRSLFRGIPKYTIIDDFWISLTILEQGKRIVFENDALAYENVSDSIKDEFWRKVRIGSGNMQTFMHKPILLIRNQFPLFSYYSHKVIRWMIPILLILMYISLIYLKEIPLFLIGFYLANLFIAIALLGFFLKTRNKIICIISYFFVCNLALLFGYIRYLRGKQNVLWRRAER